MANKKVAIIASTGGLDSAYKVLNIATAATTFDAEVAIFFTFDGLNIIHKEGHKNLALPPGLAGFQEGFARAGVPEIGELLEVARETGVKMMACQMTMDVVGLEKEHFVEGVEVGGAAAFLSFAFDAQITLTF